MTPKKRISALYAKAPKGRAVVCFDEFGPVEVRPQPGAAWAPRGHPKRHRANYKRPHGVRYYFAGYDVHADKLSMRQRRRKRWQEVLSFLRSLRRRYPHGRRIYLVLDNLSSHNRRGVLE